MIEIVQVPDTNRVIADGNNTLIMLSTTTGGDHFVRARIYIDDVLFLSQGWSKDDEGLCSFNLKHLYYSYFENLFSTEIVTGFRQKEDLFKKVKIVAEEYKVGNTNPVDSLTLPEFFIIKNHRPQVFDDSLTVQFLHLPQENINVSRDGGFIFPLFLKAGASLTVSVTNPLGQEIFSEELQNFETQVAQYELDLKDIASEGLEFIYVKFSTPQDAVQKKLKFINESIFPAKQVFYLNNCGFYCVAYLLGRHENENSLSPKSYAQFDGTEVTYDVEDVKELRLNSGHGYLDITKLIHAIATSLDVRMQLEGYWERVKSETKKVPGYEDNKFVYSEALQFSRVNVANFTNENTYAMMPQLEDIVATGNENQQLQVSKMAFLNAYSSTQPATRLRLRNIPQHGKISYQNSEGTFSLSDMVANDPSILPFTIALEDFLSLIYYPDYLEDGSPLDVLEFQMGPAVIWSKPADLRFNIIEVPGANIPPNIVVNSIQEVALDNSGNGSKFIDATITDPEGDEVVISWEALDNAPITFDDPAIAAPTITITGGSAPETYKLKVTAVDSGSGLVSEKFISVKTSNYFVSISSSQGTSSTIFNFDVTGGKPANLVNVAFTLQSISSEQFAILYYDGSERILYGNGSTLILETTCDANGNVHMAANLVNSVQGSVIQLTARIDSVEGEQLIDEANDTTSESI